MIEIKPDVLRVKNADGTWQMIPALKGADGSDGFSPTATVSKTGDTATITISDKNGTTTATVKDGSCGSAGKEWVLKGTMTDGNAVSVDLTGCTEMMVKAEVTSTANVPIVVNDTIQLVYRAGKTNTTSRSINGFVDGLFGFQCNLSCQTDSTGALTTLMGAYSGYSSYNGLKVSQITKIGFSNPSAVTTCNVQIYAR